MRKSNRRRLLVDPEVQVSLLCRAVFYWIVCLTLMGLLTAMGVALSMPHASFDERWSRLMFVFGPAVVAGLLILPLFLFDCIRYSNRFAGPLKRLSQQLRQLAETGHADPISIRENDYWSHLVTDFNRLVDVSAQPRSAESGETASSS